MMGARRASPLHTPARASASLASTSQIVRRSLCPLSQVLPPTFARMDVKRVQGKPSVQSTLDCD